MSTPDEVRSDYVKHILSAARDENPDFLVDLLLAEYGTKAYNAGLAHAAKMTMKFYREHGMLETEE
jgi:hypothetical protein